MTHAAKPPGRTTGPIRKSTRPKDSPQRSALIAGATGLVGREVLTLLETTARYGAIHALTRRPLPRFGDKTHAHRVDFARLPALPSVDDVFICLGTTIKTAGSQNGFRAVDLDAVLAVAEGASSAGARRLAVLSALGADANSLVFYNRVKGEMEAAVSRLGYESVAILRPSLLAGEREALGQPARFGEQLSLALLRPWTGLIPKPIRPVAPARVARTMVDALEDPPAGVSIIESAAMHD